MNKEIQFVIHTRDYMKTPHHFIQYKIWKKRVVILIRSSKKEFNQDAIQSNKINPSIIWKHLKGVCPDKQIKALNSLNIDGEVITNESEIANALKSFYANALS